MNSNQIHLAKLLSFLLLYRQLALAWILSSKSRVETLKLFERIQLDPSWAFADKTRKDTSYITHGYHRYPAKFIPQLVSRLAEKYTKEEADFSFFGIINQNFYLSIT